MPDRERRPKPERPVVILWNSPLNASLVYPLVMVAPLTTKVKNKHACDLELFPEDGVKEHYLLKLNLTQPLKKTDLSYEPVGSLTQDAIDRMIALFLTLLGVDMGS